MDHIGVLQLLLALTAGLACGFLNTVASSGSAVSLPILMLIGLDPLTANATNRIPVLLGAVSASVSFHKRHLMEWRLVLRASPPVIAGAVSGAILAQQIPTREMGLVVTGAVMIALLLLFTKLKKVLAIEQTGPARLGLMQSILLLAVGFWFGLIVIDAGTYLLLILTLAVGLNLTKANAIKNALSVPATLIAMIIFSFAGKVDWYVGSLVGLGSILGASIGARVASSERTKRLIFPILILTISAELIHLLWQYLISPSALG
jgi:uncharacterized membrane protein YfcA